MTAYRIKATVSEDDVYALVQRYGASTIFTLLQEVSQATEKDVKIDWKTLVKATSTGINNAREYQVLWRYLAYKDPLEKVEDGGEPLSDESDLECELEATPNPAKEVLTEVDCCVKILLSSGAVDDYGPLVASTVVALPTTNTPNDQASVIPSDKQHLSRYSRTTNGAASLARRQQLSSGMSIVGLNGNGSLNYMFPAKKKRKLWSKEEDMELIAAVEKFGEGNWANILKGDFKHDRSASQLSQRWAIIRKRKTNSNQSTSNKSKSEEMLAAQKAFSMALNMPMSGSLSTILSGGTQNQIANSSTSMAGGTISVINESHAITASQAFKQNQQPSNQEPLSHKEASNISNKPKCSQKKPPAQMKPSICPNPLIKAAAFAAGGRIATPSTAASLFKAAQSRNVVRIRHGGVTSLSGSSVTSTTVSSPSSTTTAPVTATTGGSHDVNPRFVHHPTASKLCHAKGGGSGKVSRLPPSTSMQHLSSESKSAEVIARCGLHENAKRRRSVIVSDVDINELLSEEARGAQDKETSDMQVIELDDSSRVPEGEVNGSQSSENGFLQQSSEVNGGGDEAAKQSSDDLDMMAKV